MELRQLKSFVLIAQWRSFTKAAEFQGYAQSTVTTHINMLECELGVRLFERLGHKISLTTKGSVLLSYAEKVLQLTAEAKTVVTSSDETRGRLTIGIGESIATYRLPKILREYQQRYPKVEIVLKYANCSEIRDFIGSNEVDVGLLIDSIGSQADFTVKIVSCEYMMLLMSPDNPLAQLQVITPGDLTRENVIITELGCSFRLNMESMLAKYEVKPHSFLQASGIEAIKQFVINGLGVGILPLFTVEREITDKIIYAVNFQEYSFDYAFQIVHHRDKWISPALGAFLEITTKGLRGESL